MHSLQKHYITSVLLYRKVLRDFIVSSSCRLLSGKRKDSGAKASKKYSDTLLLPKTSFPISMKNAAAREPDIQSVSH